MLEVIYKNQEEKMLLSKINDKIKFCESKNKIQVTDFLDLNEQMKAEKYLKSEKVNNYIFTGAFEEAERKILLLYPKKLVDIIANVDLNKYIKVIRISLPEEQKGEYEHKNYLGALMKLGLKREKIGDIIVSKDGADILILPEVEKFLISNLSSLTRFQKAKIELVNISNLRKLEIKKEKFNITVSSMRLDCIIAEITHSSRSKAEEILIAQRVFVNNECITKQTKEIKQGDRITIRGKGRFVIGDILKTTRSNRIILEIEKYC